MSSSESEFSASFSSDSSYSTSQESLPDIAKIELSIDNEEYTYDEELEPVATEEETAAYHQQVAAELQQEEELRKRFNEEVDVQSW